MGLLSLIKNWFYQILTRSRIIYYLLLMKDSVLHNYIVQPGPKRANHKNPDAKGKTLLCNKVNGRLYPPFGVERYQTFSDIAIRESDILLCGYPKTGCHWTHEIIHMLVTGKAELTKYGKLSAGMLEYIPDIVLDSTPSPRVLNTHLLFDELPWQAKEKKNKIVLTVRNPKDVVVSYYNHCKAFYFYEYDGDFDDFFPLFLTGRHEYGSYFDFVLSWEEEMKNPTTNQILLMEFEEMKANPEESIRRIAKFLEIEVSDKFVKDIEWTANFKTMRMKRSYSDVFRKGEVGDWRNWLSDEQSAAIDKVWREKMSGSSYKPKY